MYGEFTSHFILFSINCLITAIILHSSAQIGVDNPTPWRTDLHRCPWFTCNLSWLVVYFPKIIALLSSYKRVGDPFWIIALGRRFLWLFCCCKWFFFKNKFWSISHRLKLLGLIYPKLIHIKPKFRTNIRWYNNSVSVSSECQVVAGVCSKI